MMPSNIAENTVRDAERKEMLELLRMPNPTAADLRMIANFVQNNTVPRISFEEMAFQLGISGTTLNNLLVGGRIKTPLAKVESAIRFRNWAIRILTPQDSI